MPRDRRRGYVPPDKSTINHTSLRSVSRNDDIFELTPDDVEAVRLSREAVARGEIATNEEVQALWAKYGL